MSKKIVPMDKHRPKGPPKAVLLARVSHKDQEEGYSIAGQKYQLEQYCARKGLEVVQIFEIVESSTRGNRKDFMKMIDYIRKQKDCIALVADKIDRVQRSFKEYPLLDGLIQEGRLELHFNTKITSSTGIRPRMSARCGVWAWCSRSLMSIPCAITSSAAWRRSSVRVNIPEPRR